MRARAAEKFESQGAIANRWRRHAFQMAHRSLEEYRATLRDEVLREAEALRQEARRQSPRHAAIAEELVTRLAHHVVALAPPLPRIEGDYERIVDLDRPETTTRTEAV